MKKEELTTLGLSDEQIKGVFKLNGIDVENAKKTEKDSLQPTIDNLNAQLKTAQDGLKKFDGIDPEKLSAEIQTLNETLATQKADFEKQIADRDFNDLLNATITGAKGKNVKAISANLDIDTLKASKNQKEDINNAVEACKKEFSYLFDSDEPIKNPVGGTGNDSGTGANGTPKITDAMRLAVGLPPLKKE